MTLDHSSMSVARRFLQVRRREPLQEREITQVLHPDVVYTEIVHGERWVLTGAGTVLGLLRRFWSGMAMEARMQVIRQWPIDEHTVTAQWRRIEKARTVDGRDTYTIEDGLITAILVEEFENVVLPDPMVVPPLVKA